MQGHEIILYWEKINIFFSYCTNADSSSADDGYWCPITVSDEFNYDDCTPAHIIYAETCDQTISHCTLEDGNSKSEVVDPYIDPTDDDF